jgi:hypothetical protein
VHVNADLQLKATMVLVWLAFIGMMFRGLPKSLTSKRWVQVGGRVISIRKESRQRGVRNVYFPVVSYSYSFEGRQHQSESFTFLGTSGGLGGAGFDWQVERRLRPFTANSSVSVYVNPKVPAEAVLVPGVHWSQYVALAGVTLFCLGVAFIVELLNFVWPGCQPNCT